MIDYNEQQKVARAMIRWGGAFVSSLGFALTKAVLSDAQKIKDTFPEYWAVYLEKSEKLEE